MIQWQFLGGADTVTGSKHLLSAYGKQILFDCGMFQGRRAEAEAINRNLGLNPATLDAVSVSHAHIDHCGCLPLLVKGGYAGPIYTTSATADLLPIMLRDSAHIQEADAAYLNQKTSRKGLPPVEPLYTMADAEAVFPLIHPHPYHDTIALPDGPRLTYYDAGHILGAAITVVEIPRENQPPFRIVLTFDLGRKNLPLLQDPEITRDDADNVFKNMDVDVLITESTYGARMHADALEADEELENGINLALRRGGKVMIPTFALERAQEIIYHLAELRSQGKFLNIPVYVDSPMAHAVSQVFAKHPEYLDAETASLHEKIGSVVMPDWVTFTASVEESKAITASKEPSITLAASGMCENGRIRHHLKHGIENPNNVVLLVGYQAVNTLGRRLQDGEKVVRIFGDEFNVRATIQSLPAFSAHADRLDLLATVRLLRPRKIFLVHGEQEQRETFAGRVKENIGLEAILPTNGDAPYVLDETP